jgi:hypothetical protein
VVIAAVLTVTLGACGGSGGELSGDAVARVGAASITRGELDHWMTTLSGGDFYEVARGHTSPAGLVSEPPNYPTCVSSLQAAATKAQSQPKPTFAAPQESSAKLLAKCHQLYVALRLQAIKYLIDAKWTLGVYAVLGVTVSDQEIAKELSQVKSSEFPKPGQFDQYLADSRRSLADELLVVKLDLASHKMQQKVAKEGKQTIRRLSEAAQRLTAKTNCRPGYVVPHCRQFRKWKGTAPSPAVLLEQVATITGIPCANREACG